MLPRTVHRHEASRVSHRVEPSHLPLALPWPLMIVLVLLRVVSHARHHPSTWWETKRRAASLLSKLQSASSHEDFRAAVSLGRSMTPTEASAHVLAGC